MAVFQGARTPAVALPARRVRRSVTDLPLVGRSLPRPRASGLLLGGILVLTMVALVYQTPTLTSNATSSEITQLGWQKAELSRKIRNQAMAVTTHADPVEVASRARDLGLRQLDKALVLSAP